MRKIYLLLILLTLCGVVSRAQTYNYRLVKDSLYVPWEMIWGYDDHIWFTQTTGYICRMDPNTGHVDTLYHEPAVYTAFEGGMLGMAMHPQFPTQPYVYVGYSFTDILSPGPSYDYLRIVRYTYNGSQFQNPLILLDSIQVGNVHAGCRLLISGDKLFFTHGDGTFADSAQKTSSLKGKILRINLDGTIPVDNPFPGSPVWTKGNRNAQGLTFVNNVLFSSEHGDATDDEINIIEKGRNYGWPNVEGFCDQPAEITFCTDSNVKEPIYAWTPTIAPSGMEYYDLPKFPSLQKSLLLATLKDMKLHQLKLDASLTHIIYDSIVRINGFTTFRLRDVCFSPQGRIFISTSNSPSQASPWPYTPPTNKNDRIIELLPDSVNSVSQTNSLIAQLYPNPVNNTLYLPGMANTKWSYSITDIMGREILHERDKTTTDIDVQTLVTGVYFIKLKANHNYVQALRFLKY